jgi:hypothetical protein
LHVFLLKVVVCTRKKARNSAQRFWGGQPLSSVYHYQADPIARKSKGLQAMEKKRDQKNVG